MTVETGAINARTVPIVEYGIDPVGWRMFAGLSRVLQRATSAGEGLAAVRRGADFTGYTASPQSFRGMAPLGLSKPVVRANTEIGDERSALLDDTAMRIFAERLKRSGS